MRKHKTIISEENGSIKLTAIYSQIKEDCGFSTLDNTQGIGNAQPPSLNNIGSGDKWNNDTINKKKKKETNEEMVNPSDKLGNKLLKSFKVNTYFKNNKSGIKQNNVKKIKIKTLQDYIKNM